MTIKVWVQRSLVIFSLFCCLVVDGVCQVVHEVGNVNLELAGGVELELGERAEAIREDDVLHVLAEALRLVVEGLLDGALAVAVVADDVDGAGLGKASKSNGSGVAGAGNLNDSKSKYLVLVPSTEMLGGPSTVDCRSPDVMTVGGLEALTPTMISPPMPVST